MGGRPPPARGHGFSFSIAYIYRDECTRAKANTHARTPAAKKANESIKRRRDTEGTEETTEKKVRRDRWFAGRSNYTKKRPRLHSPITHTHTPPGGIRGDDRCEIGYASKN